jgi:hypothetical protein
VEQSETCCFVIGRMEEFFTIEDELLDDYEGRA